MKERFSWLRATHSGSFAIDLITSSVIIAVFIALLAQALVNEQKTEKALWTTQVIREDLVASLAEIENRYAALHLPNSVTLTLHRPLSALTTTLDCESPPTPHETEEQTQRLYLNCISRDRCLDSKNCDSRPGEVAWNMR